MKKHAQVQNTNADSGWSFREVKCYFPFFPPGERCISEQLEFLGLISKAKLWKTEKERTDTATQAKVLAKRQRAFEKTEQGKFWKELSAMIKSAVAKNPSKYDNDWLTKHEHDLKSAGVYDLTKLQLESVAKEKEWTRAEEMLDAERKVWDALEILLTGAMEKRTDAADVIFEVGLWITGFLEKLYKSDPELFQKKAAYYAQIPVIAELNPKWVGNAEEHLKRLSVGKGLAKSRFKPIAYEDDLYVCRAWAREVVECIDANRYTCFLVADIYDYLENGDRNVVPAKMPSWLKELPKLPPFGKSTAKQWASVARRIIRQEIPDFHERPEFTRVVSNIKRRFRDAPGKTVKRAGTIQNAILDKIGEAIESIAEE